VHFLACTFLMISLFSTNQNFEAFKEVQFKKNNELSQLLESLYQMQLQLCTRQSDFLTRQQKLKRNSESTILGSPTSLAEEKRETHLVSRFGAFQKEAQDVAPPTLRRGNLWGKISACLRSGDYENAFTLVLIINIKFYLSHFLLGGWSRHCLQKTLNFLNGSAQQFHWTNCLKEIHFRSRNLFYFH
jgi:hypothetical protein